MDHKKSLDTTDKVLSSLWSIGIAVAAWLIVVIIVFGIRDFKSTAPLVGAFAILISAGIASASVMKSIHTAKINDIEKAEKEKERKRIFALNVIKTIQVTLTAFSKKVPTQFPTFDTCKSECQSKSDFDSDIQTTGKLISSVFCESILPYLSDEEQNIISNFYSEYHRFLSTYEQLDVNPVPTYNPKRNPPMNLQEYAKIFTTFAQSYIDLNTKHKR